MIVKNILKNVKKKLDNAFDTCIIVIVFDMKSSKRDKQVRLRIEASRSRKQVKIKKLHYSLKYTI